MDRFERSDVGLEIPIRRPTPIIVRRRHRQSGIPAEDAGKLPASHDCIYSLVGISQKGVAFSKGGLPNYVCIDVVADVKVRIGVIIVLTNRIHNKGTVTLEVPADSEFRLEAGSIVERMRPGVVEVEDQAREALAIGNRKSVVVGIADGAPRGQGPILRLHETGSCKAIGTYRIASIWVSGAFVVRHCQIGFGLDI